MPRRPYPTPTTAQRRFPHLACLGFVAAAGALQGGSISVNFAVTSTADQQIVDPGETSVVGISGAVSLDGTNWDGVIEWQRTNATSSGGAVGDASYPVFGPFTGDALSISGAGTAGRSALSGIQIVRHSGPLADIVSFTATPGSFAAGETVSLAWEVLDADSVSIDHGVGTVAATGSLALAPTTATTWTLTATRGTTSVVAEATAAPGKGSIVVYLLGGQSNMQGTGRSSKLPADLQEEIGRRGHRQLLGQSAARRR